MPKPSFKARLRSGRPAGGCMLALFSPMVAEIVAGACSPNVVGVGLGGSFETCARLAKEAAILRPIGDKNPDDEVARLESILMDDVLKLKLGPMGMGGSTSAFDVHVELAYCHMATLPVAVYLQCSAMRRTTVRLYEDGRVEGLAISSWLRC